MINDYCYRINKWVWNQSKENKRNSISKGFIYKWINIKTVRTIRGYKSQTVICHIQGRYSSGENCLLFEFHQYYFCFVSLQASFSLLITFLSACPLRCLFVIGLGPDLHLGLKQACIYPTNSNRSNCHLYFSTRFEASSALRNHLLKL